MSPLLGIFLIFAGLFSTLAAVLDWNWFMMHRKARLFVALFGRTGARVFYVLLGLGLAAVGVAGLLGMLPGGSGTP